MNTFAALADPTRRRLVEELGRGERTAGELAALARDEFGLSQPATSRHLRILRDAEVVQSRVDGARRLYTLEPQSLETIDDWLDQFRSLWSSALAALGTEVARGRRTPTQDTTTTTTNQDGVVA
ncbi:metalloregulator ArsR/SmtB family transcription factor [Aeromicrobium alkaliterrae]|uniref:Metalloregulator ArsR/SmtB family transcription factor n=1 Tax=Aeromicrobium alkaliterrae TaxID=302168 RepID=A0ABP4W9X9_9ACTN